MRYNKVFSGKFIYLIPFGLIFLINLFITQIKGFEYAGQLAVFLASSSFLAIILGMRWDVSLLTKPLDKSGMNIIYGLISIAVISIFFFCLLIMAYFFSGIFNTSLGLILLASVLIAISELLINIFLKFKKSSYYLIFRSLPYIFLFFISFLDFSIEASWIFSSLFSLFLLVLISAKYFFELNFIHIESLTFAINEIALKIIPTISAVVTNSIMLFWLVYIQHHFGDELTGIWINAYRIFSLPIALTGAAFLPILLNSLAFQESYKSQIIKMTNFNFFLLFLSLIVMIMIFTYGNEIFKILTDSSILISSQLMLSALSIGFLQYSLQYWKELFQSIDKNLLFLLIVITQPFFAASIYFLYVPSTLIALLSLILLVSSLSLIILFLVCIYIFLFTSE